MRPLLFALLLTLAPSAAAQAHEHGNASGVVISHDLPDDGRTYVGDISHFGVLVLGDDVVPDFHQQIHIRVTENGVVLFETTPDSGHDYDGVNTFDVVFPVEGSYVVEALDDMGMTLTAFPGTVFPADPSHKVSLDLQMPKTAPALATVHLTLAARETNGNLVNHSDTLVEVRQGANLLLRTHAHSHFDIQTLDIAFPEPGTYTVRATAYISFPSLKSHPFAPQSVERTLTIGTAAPSASLPVNIPPLQQPITDKNAVVTGHGSGGDYVILGTFDPYTIVAPTTQQHIDILDMDPATHMPVPHVDFTAKLVGPAGNVLFASDSLHEYDGIYEFTAVQPVPGQYVLSATANAGAWSGIIAIPYTVAPPAEPVVVANVPPSPAAGLELVESSGLDGLVAGKTATIGFSVHDLAGAPLDHSEIDVQAIDAAGVPILTTKLHTHDGTFAFSALFPTAGAYTLRLSPFPQDLQPVVFAGATPTAPLELPLTVAAGPGVPAVPASTDTLPESHATSLAPLAALAAIGVALLLRRR